MRSRSFLGRLAAVAEDPAHRTQSRQQRRSLDRASRRQRLSQLAQEQLEGRAMMARLVPGLSVTDEWNTGFNGDVVLANESATVVEGWRVQFDYDGEIATLWNGVIEDHTGSTFTVSSAVWNAVVAPGSSVNFGFTAASAPSATLTNLFVLDAGGTAGTPQDDSGDTGGIDHGDDGVPPAVDPPAGDPLPDVSLPLQVAFRVADVQVVEGTRAEGGVRGPLATSGNQIVDAAGNTVRIAGVNWFGMETTTFAPHGLWTRGYREMMDQMRSLGFNTIRLPYSDQLFEPTSTPNGIDFSKNPDLSGLSGIEVMDAIVSYAEEIGLWVILDHHRSEAGNSASDTGLWWSAAYPERVWIDNLTMLASRYAAQSAVVGIDLHNEPHGPATWGDGSATDWRLAAERAGNAVLAANPNLLIIVEGIEHASSGSYWWGGNLSSAGAFPVRLNVEGRLVYSPHDYPASVYQQMYFSDPAYPANLPEVWDANWGFLFREGIAPVMVGEFGSNLATASDRAWFSSMIDYLAGDLDGDGVSDLTAGQQGISWTYWSWNPNSGDTGGILADIWNARIVARVGTRYTIAPLDYNAVLAAGQRIVVGFQGAGVDAALPAGFT
ncbi:MAG: cellulase family glycosylhydrolase [Pirellulales bacterium]